MQLPDAHGTLPGNVNRCLVIIPSSSLCSFVRSRPVLNSSNCQQVSVILRRRRCFFRQSPRSRFVPSKQFPSQKFFLLATKQVLGKIGEFKSMVSTPLRTRLQRISRPREPYLPEQASRPAQGPLALDDLPDELMFIVTDRDPAEPKKQACISLVAAEWQGLVPIQPGTRTPIVGVLVSSLVLLTTSGSWA